MVERWIELMRYKEVTSCRRLACFGNCVEN